MALLVCFACALFSRQASAAEVLEQTAPDAVRAGEVIADIQIHGNNATPDVDVLAIAGVVKGQAFSPETLTAVKRRLIESDRFEGADVFKRFASISDPSQISLVILVDERPVRIVPGVPGDASAPTRIVRRRFGRGPMVLPILDVEDGYGITYGGALAFPGVTSRQSRVTVPLSWGGRKRAAVELDQPLTGPLGRVRVGTGVDRRRNPFFDVDDTRHALWGRAETRTRWMLRAGTTGRVERVSFGGSHDVWKSVGVDVTFDTRADPTFPRNAVLAEASRTHTRGAAGSAFNRDHVGVRGFVGLRGSPVLAVQLEHDTADRPLPEVFKPLLGGWSSVRGFRAGTAVGDNRLVTSAGLRVPMSSPLSVARIGVSVFVDAGKVYDHGQRLRDTPWHTGFGAGVWLAATVVKAGVSVAHGRGGETRVGVGIGVEY